ncbi:DUF7573 domain-containing protein [Halobellus limi]|uniref:DUF7573 domain-containing protein n=1 Tax=Halobellus limi TaxID=699433 RepID=A0A1H5VUE9_9EURY|nr:hypothetical protein [Halobellus limi]QCC46621.1 hypothetical protein DV707_02450 [Halobellus limi]SEF90626.1 hypothetical protein SAMN04488133_1066 [Halobellus limi]
MARDRSLDEFAVDGASDAADRESTADGEDGSADEEADGPEEEASRGSAEETSRESTDEASQTTDTASDPIGDAEVEPATATYQWDPEGVECPGCGRTVDRLWLQGDERVCADCKEW